MNRGLMRKAKGCRQGWALSGIWRDALVSRKASKNLAEFTRAFAENNGRTEPDFDHLGRTLRGLHTIATEMTNLVRRRAEDLRGALVQSRFAGTDGLASQSLKELRVTLEETARSLESLRMVGSDLRQLQSQVEGIQRIGVYLKTSVLNFAVESVRTPECRDAFGAFVDELRLLATRISDLGENICQEVKTTRSSQAQGFDSIASGLDEMRRLVQHLEQTSHATADEAQEILDASCAAMQEAERCAIQIARHAEDAVYHMQFGDIVRQKCEHIIASLQDAAELLKTSSKSSASKCTAADGVLAIQIHQLESVRQEVLAAHAKLADSFQGIGAETSRLAQALQKGQSTLRMHGSYKDPLEALSADTQRVNDLLQQGSDLGQHARNTARDAAEASTRLGHHLDDVKSINRDMHLQALNAIVKTAALGRQGATLEVLSMEVDRLFRESNREVEQIIATLQAILHQAQDNGTSSGALEMRGSSSVNGSMRDGLERIARAYEQFKESTNEARSLVQKQESSLALSGVELKFLPSLADTLTRQLQSLDSLRQLLAPAVHPELLPAETTVSLEQRYTMQSEREIHDRVSGTASLSEAAGLQSNVGLPSPIEASLLPPANVTVLEVLSETDKPRDEQSSPTPQTTEPSFGDNVELF